ncbi:hypothetical protein CAI16_19750 [Virgibacillus dokdonensis]|uniref:Uncharacterized protein n=1 Tax=Virgibacillus dokdonensis TaxID=302167 RepID=A0A3E0WHA5_9BACI|nr:hypothetical protein [Virgibacillus dokdonensis]RFA31829.1 hypothetical protein CAI16_19750 [Virgibacillus dokdonensis]
MAKSVWRIRDYTTTITASTDQFEDMFNANFEAGYALRNRLSENSISNNLSGISGSALSLLLGVAGATVSSTATSIAGIILSMSSSELSAQERVLDHGARALQDVYRYLDDHSSYISAEVLFGFLEYEYSDGSKARFVQGRDYQVKRVLSSSGGWITL